MTQKDYIVKSIKFDKETEREIRILAAKEGISFGEWVRRVMNCKLAETNCVRSS